MWRPDATDGRRVSLHQDPSPCQGPGGFSHLITAIAERGDRDAFASLFQHFAPRVKSYLLRLGASSEAAEELAQETLLTVWRRAASFDPALSAASTWIFTIARNLRVDLARREMRAAAPRPVEVSPPEPGPDQALGAVQDQARIAKAMGELPAEQAEVIREAFFADKPHSEIARDLGLPLGTVKSRMRLALIRLRARLAEPEDSA
ncbi:MAG: sigma-70 family RNA polymerase sigma factor [Alphaproteobacteria bacterium]|nr:sigma-70 family RNA polymerase sigma factor [Alphaproteobacteria bacterium]